jgi:hypothetical protein
MGALAGQAIHVRRFQEGLGLHKAEGVISLVVDQYKDDVAALAGRGGRRGGERA